MEAICIKIKDAQQVGEYKRTTIDERKDAADFLVINVRPNIIRWRDGRKETVTSRKLRELSAQHPNWMADF